LMYLKEVRASISWQSLKVGAGCGGAENWSEVGMEALVACCFYGSTR
jgi:hypothetical protein